MQPQALGPGDFIHHNKLPRLRLVFHQKLMAPDLELVRLLQVFLSLKHAEAPDRSLERRMSLVFVPDNPSLSSSPS